MSTNHCFEMPEAWQKPDLSLIAGYSEKPKFPLEIFGPASRWIEDAAAACNASTDYIGGALLATVSGLMANTRRARAWGDFVQPPILWIVLIGRPSTRKTPAIRAVTDTISEIECALRPAHEENLRIWETCKLAAEEALNEWKADAKAASKEGAPPPCMPQQAVAPPRPVEPRRLITDATTEAVSPLLADEKARGLLLLNDELSGWFGSMDAYKSARGADRAFWTRAYDGGPHRVDRKGSEPVHIPRLSVAILGGIQPDHVVGKMMLGPDDGLTARFILLWPDPVPPKRCDTPVDRSQLSHALNSIHGLAWGKDEFGEAGPMVIKLSEHAQAIFQDWREKHFRESQASHGLLEGHYGKMDGMALRLSLILEHLWWAWGRDPDEPAEIGEKAMLAALGFIDGYVKPMAAVVYGDARLSEQEQAALKLFRWVKGQGLPEVNVRDSYKKGPMRNAEEARNAFAVLAEANIARESLKPTTGRTRVDFEVNPKIWRDD